MKSLWIFRIGALLLLIVVSFKPVATRSAGAGIRSAAVLLDVSPSMRVKDPVKRLDAAAAAVKSLLKVQPDVLLFAFSNQTASIDASFLTQPATSGSRSNLADALTTAFQKKPFQAGVIFSDGRQIGNGDPVSVAASIGRPLLVVGVGDKSLFKDISIRRVQSPPFAFKNIPITLSATVSVTGFSGKAINVYLKEGSKIIGTQIVSARGTEFETEVSFTWTPTSLGSKTLVVEANPEPSEVSVANNRKEFNLDIGRDRFRVLYVSGNPGPEYGFLRHQFKSDPGVELVTFVILRNASNQLNVPDAELSLIPFPTEDIFVQQMSSFDLVVFDEFSYRRFGLSPALMAAIKKRVEVGGSFLLIGDEDIFGPPSDYRFPGVDDMLPVELSVTPMARSAAPQTFFPKVLNHPIFQIEKNERVNASIWKNAPKLDDTLFGLKPKSDASVLATMRTDSGETPILVTWKWKQGRVAAFGARTTFRWSMQNNNPESEGLLYSQFWKNMVLWLTHSSDDKAVRLGLEDKKWVVNRGNTIRVWVFDSYFKPLSDATVRITVTWPDNTRESKNLVMETPGVYATSLEAKLIGKATIQAWANRQGRSYGNDTLRVQIIDDQSEEEDLRPDFSMLTEMAKVSQGQFIPLSEFSASTFKEFQKQSEAKMGRKILLWNSPWMLGAILLFFFLDLILRRKAGLP